MTPLESRTPRACLLAAGALLLPCLVACSKPTTKPNVDDAATGSPLDASTAEPIDAGPWSAWDMAKRRAAWQGFHAMPGPGDSWIAIHVEGTKMTVWDGKTEARSELDIYGPCEAGVSGYGTGAAKGGWVGTYTIENGALITGLGNVGSKKGSEAIACVMGKMVTLDAQGNCVAWTRKPLHPTEYESTPGVCGWETKNGATLFTATVYKMRFELEVHGDALYDRQIAGAHSQVATDWAMAKALRDKH